MNNAQRDLLANAFADCLATIKLAGAKKLLLTTSPYRFHAESHSECVPAGTMATISGLPDVA